MATPTQQAATASPLKGFIERIEALQRESAEALAMVQEVYDQAKAAGYDVARMKDLIKERKRPEQVVQEENIVLDLYRAEMRRGGTR